MLNVSFNIYALMFYLEGNHKKTYRLLRFGPLLTCYCSLVLGATLPTDYKGYPERCYLKQILLSRNA